MTEQNQQLNKGFESKFSEEDLSQFFDSLDIPLSPEMLHYVLADVEITEAYHKHVESSGKKHRLDDDKDREAYYRGVFKTMSQKLTELRKSYFDLFEQYADDPDMLYVNIQKLNLLLNRTRQIVNQAQLELNRIALKRSMELKRRRERRRQRLEYMFFWRKLGNRRSQVAKG